MNGYSDRVTNDNRSTSMYNVTNPITENKLIKYFQLQNTNIPKVIVAIAGIVLVRNQLLTGATRTSFQGIINK